METASVTSGGMALQLYYHIHKHSSVSFPELIWERDYIPYNLVTKEQLDLIRLNVLALWIGNLGCV